LNTSTVVTPYASQNDLGVLGGDNSGFPNGRRPIDDVVDITLRVAMGVLLMPYDGSAKDPDPASDASRQLGYTDGVQANPAYSEAGVAREQLHLPEQDRMQEAVVEMQFPLRAK
jgi:hypothetical protein